MIIDKLDNWKIYSLGPAWNKAFEFLVSLKENAEEGEYKLQGDDIFVRIMNYKTRDTQTAMLEAHRKYIDIQMLLLGKERIECFNLKELTSCTLYDEAKDAEFFNYPANAPVHIDLYDKTFAILFPHDAHMPTLAIGNEPCLVKKVVVKFRVGLLKL